MTSSRTPGDKLLFTPGPLTTSATVKQAMLRDLGSRDSEFLAAIEDVRSGLLQLAGVSQELGYETVPLQGSGTYAIEAVISSAVPATGKLLVAVNGAYGERMVKIAEVHGIAVEVLSFSEASPVEPTESEYADPSLPVDDSDEGSDTGETEMCQPWRSQHPGIQIDPDLDVISDNGKEIYSFLHARKIETLLILGVHTNMCILHRSFGIKQMVRWGVRPILIRDLTDAMYNPAMSPYVSHEAGTDLVIGYIEKFWCPTMLSSALA